MKQLDFIVRFVNEKDLWDDKLTVFRNGYLKVSGSVDTNLYYIKSGSLRMYVIDKFEEHTIRLGYKNNLIVSLDSYISESPSDYYIQAIKQSELSVIKKETFKGIIESTQEVHQYWNEVLEQVIYQQLEREMDLLTSSPLERYERVLRRNPQLFQEIPGKFIASYLRMPQKHCPE